MKQIMTFFRKIQGRNLENTAYNQSRDPYNPVIHTYMNK